jgi:hypothetical protein
MRLPKQRGGLPLLLSGSRQPGAWQAPRRPHDSDRPVPVCGVRAFPVGPDREGRGEPRMRLPKRRGGLPVLLSGSRQPGAWQTPWALAAARLALAPYRLSLIIKQTRRVNATASP